MAGFLILIAGGFVLGALRAAEVHREGGWTVLQAMAIGSFRTRLHGVSIWWWNLLLLVTAVLAWTFVFGRAAYLDLGEMMLTTLAAVLATMGVAEPASPRRWRPA